jgi:hypothetical protein
MTKESAALAARIQEPVGAPVRPIAVALHPAAFGGGILACLLAVSACGSSSAQPAAAPAGSAVPVTAATARPACANGSAFALSLVSDRGGQPTPVAAAAWFARHGGVVGVPARGWRRLAAMAAARPSSLARSCSTSSRDPTGHGRSIAATGVPDSCGTPTQPSGRHRVPPPIRATSAA